jgi:hypothetical protein
VTLPEFELAYVRAPAACLCLMSEVDMIAVGMVLDVYLLTGISLSAPSAASMRRPVPSHLATLYHPTSAWIQRAQLEVLQGAGVGPGAGVQQSIIGGRQSLAKGEQV